MMHAIRCEDVQDRLEDFHDDELPLDQHLETHAEPSGSPQVAPDNMLAQKRLASELRRALESLPFDQRTVVVLREIDGLSYDEIAFSLGVTLGTVKSRLTRARRALRDVLQETAA